MAIVHRLVTIFAIGRIGCACVTPWKGIFALLAGDLTLADIECVAAVVTDAGGGIVLVHEAGAG
jgi:hypothetical protein